MLLCTIIGLLTQVLLSRCQSSDVQAFSSILPSVPIRQETLGLRPSNIDDSSTYGVNIVQHGNNFFFKPNFSLGPKYKPLIKDKEYNPIEPPLTKYVDAHLTEEAVFPKASVLSPVIMPNKQEIRPQSGLEVFSLPNSPIKQNGDEQVILGHSEPLPSIKGTLSVHELIPMLYELFKPYLTNTNSERQGRGTQNDSSKKMQQFTTPANQDPSRQSPGISPYKAINEQSVTSPRGRPSNLRNRRKNRRIQAALPRNYASEPSPQGSISNMEVLEDKLSLSGIYAKRDWDGALVPCLK